MLPQFTAREMEAGSEAAVRCAALTAAEVDGEVGGCPGSPSPARSCRPFKLPAQLPAFLLFNLILSA